MTEDRSKLVPFARLHRTPDAGRMAEFAAAARRLQRERDEAADLVTAAIHQTTPADWPELAQRTELHTSGVIERLGQEIERRLDSDPQAALALSELSTAIAGALLPDAYPGIMLAQLRSHAWKDRAQTLSYLARYDEALAAFDTAESYLQSFGTLAHDLAIVRFARAITLQHVRRFDEARATLEECREVFRGHGDARLDTKCALAMGNLYVRRGDHRAARATLLPLLGSGDALTEATIRCALGWCAIHLGEPEEALTHFAEVQKHSLGNVMHAARISYGVGSALLRLGRLDAAMERLGEAREFFLVHRLVEEAGLSGLDIVEAHLLRDETDEAQALCARIVGEFTAAQLNRRAIAALAYLHDCARTREATPEVVRNVQAYILALRDDPGREFASVH